MNLQDFREILGSKGVIDHPDDVAPWLTDWRKLFTGKAQAILAPATTQEASRLVALASDRRIPLVPQGGNTSMVGGATPSEDGSALIVSMRRMNQIRSINPDGNCMIAEAGVILSNLHDAATAVGRRFPLSLGAKGSATMGGLVSTNAGGTQVLRFGTMRRLVLGLEAIMPDGSIYDGLNALKKDNRGYDLNQLMIGAEGTLGLVTAASLKLVPDVTDRCVAWVGVEDPETALRLLRDLEERSGEAVESFEILPRKSLGLVLKHIPDTRAPLPGDHRWHVLIDFVQANGAREALEAHLGAAIEAGLIRDASIAMTNAQAADFWRIRESVSEAERSEAPLMSHDISVAVEDMPSFIEEAAAAIEAKMPDVTVNSYGHLGDGNIHLHVLARSGKTAPDWHQTRGKEASRFVYDLVTQAGGSISAEHGIGQMKLDELVRLSDPVRINMLRSIKAALDPLGIMNPGKLVPLAPAAQGS